MRSQLKIILCSLLLFRASFSQAQERYIDSVQKLLRGVRADTTYIAVLMSAGNYYNGKDQDSCFKYWNKGKIEAEKALKKFSPNNPSYSTIKIYYGVALTDLAYLSQLKGDMENALKVYLEVYKIQKEMGAKAEMAQVLNNIASVYQTRGQNDSARLMFLQCIPLYKEAHVKFGLTGTYLNLAWLIYKSGDAKTALCYYDTCLALQKENNDKKGIAITYNHLAAISGNRGNIPKALEYYLKGIKLLEEINDKAGIARYLNNIGAVYFDQKETDKALEFYQKSLKIEKEIESFDDMANTYNNIGLIYLRKSDPETALSYYEKALELSIQLNNKIGLATTYMNIGNLLSENNEFDKALGYLKKGLALAEELQAKSNICSFFSGIARLYVKKKDYVQAIKYGTESMKMSRIVGYPDKIKNAARVLYDSYKSINDYTRALENYEIFLQMQDSVINESSRKAGVKTQLKYEYEKQAAADSVAHAKESEIKNVELARQNAEIKAKRNQQYALYGGLVLVMVFAGFMYNRFKITQKQKLIIEEKEKETQKQNEIISRQKDLVEEKQREIVDSILYARRIQHALITSEKYIERKLNEMMNDKS